MQFGSLWYPGGEPEELWTSLAFRALSQICLVGENIPCCLVIWGKVKELECSVFLPL